MNGLKQPIKASWRLLGLVDNVDCALFGSVTISEYALRKSSQNILSLWKYFSRNPVKRFPRTRYMHKHGFAVMILALACHARVAAASFDCGGDVTQVEQQVCNNAELSRMDEDLAWLYAHIAPAAKASGKVAQRKWLRERNSCADEPCLRNAYVGRIRSLLMFANDALIRSSDATRYRTD